MSQEPTEKNNEFCSSHPDVCCLCCQEFQDRLRDEKKLYMENEREWQKTLAAERAVWKDRALAIGEQMADVRSDGYYDYGPSEWGNWMITQMARIKAEREGLEKGLCEYCHHRLNSGGCDCGAPVCCSVCCKVTRLQDKVSELKESLRREREKSEKLLHALNRVRTIDSPIYTGNHAHPLSAWQVIAHEAIMSHQKDASEQGEGK